MWNLKKNDANEMIQIRNRLTEIEKELWLPMEKGEGEDKLGVWD